MSCILVYNNVEDKKFHIASDSICSSDDTKIIIKNRKFFKKEKFIFCVAGSMKFLNIIQYELDVSFKGKIDDKVIFTTLPYRVEELCKKYDLKDTCQMLFIVNNKVYCMQSDYSVIDYNDNYRVFGLGVGEEPAVGFFLGYCNGFGDCDIKLNVDTKEKKDINYKELMNVSIRYAAMRIPGVDGDVIYGEFAYVK